MFRLYTGIYRFETNRIVISTTVLGLYRLQKYSEQVFFTEIETYPSQIQSYVILLGDINTNIAVDSREGGACLTTMTNLCFMCLFNELTELQTTLQFVLTTSFYRYVEVAP